MAFDADQYLKAMRPPSITVGGEVFTGRILSFEEMLPFQERFERVQGEGVSPAELGDLARDLCEAMGIPADKVLALPTPLVAMAIADFLASMIRLDDGPVAVETPTAHPVSSADLSASP